MSVPNMEGARKRALIGKIYLEIFRGRHVPGLMGARA